MGLEAFIRRLALDRDESLLRAVLTALLAVGACALARTVAQPALGNATGYILFFPAVVLSAVAAGRRGALIALLLSVAVGMAMGRLLQGRDFDSARAIINAALFMLAAIMTAEVGVALKNALRRVDGHLAADEAARQRLKLAHEAGNLGTWEWDLLTDLVHTSEGYRRNWGQPLGTSVPFLRLVEKLWPEDRDAVLAARERALADGGSYRSEYRVQRDDGTLGWITSVGEPVHDSGGRLISFVGVSRDVTDQKRMDQVLTEQESRQRFLLGLTDRLRAARVAGEVAIEAVAALGRELGASRVGYAEVDSGGGGFTVEHDWTAEGVASIDGVHDGLAFGRGVVEAARAGRTIRVEDVSTSHLTQDGAPGFASMEVRGFMAVPLLSDGILKAFFFVHQTTPRRWSDADVLLTEEVAERTWRELDRARAEIEIRESEERFRSIADSAPVLVWVTNRDRSRAFVNRTYVDYFGGDYEGALNADWRELLHPEDALRIRDESLAGEATLKPFELEGRYRHHTGLFRWLRSYSRPRLAADGTLLGFVGVAYDVTEAKQVEADLTRINELLEDRVAAALAEKADAEAQLLHAQKLEAVGQLTGGVAHDFNNLLTVVIGALDLILKPGADEVRRTRMAEAALSAARRGERLTHQLLAFSRRQTLRPTVLDINGLIRESEPLWRRAVGEAVTLDLSLAARGARARVDAGQFEAALLNLLVNARDATPDGGSIRVRTRPVKLTAGEVLEVEPGAYICVEIADTGEGIPPEVIERVFEPFFTTKAVGKGTGLGLSQVYGFARQSGGGIAIESDRGAGTSVRLFLPAASVGEMSAEPRPTEEPCDLDGLTILLVEDDADVAATATDLLSDMGLRVTRAASGGEALEFLAKDDFQLMLTDVVMPGGMSGFELSRQVTERWPRTRIILTSGYTGDAIDAGIESAPWPFLPKPYSLDTLRARLAEAAR